MIPNTVFSIPQDQCYPGTSCSKTIEINCIGPIHKGRHPLFLVFSPHPHPCPQPSSIHKFFLEKWWRPYPLDPSPPHVIKHPQSDTPSPTVDFMWTFKTTTKCNNINHVWSHSYKIVVVLKYHWLPWANIFDTDICRGINIQKNHLNVDIYASKNVSVKDINS